MPAPPIGPGAPGQNPPPSNAAIPNRSDIPDPRDLKDEEKGETE